MRAHPDTTLVGGSGSIARIWTAAWEIPVRYEPSANTASPIRRLRPGEYLGDWGARGANPQQRLQELLARLDITQLYEPDPTKVAELRGIALAPGEVLHGALTTFPSRRASYVDANRLTLYQRRDGVAAGGSTYEFRLTRARGLHPVPPDDEAPDPERLAAWEVWYRIESLPLP